MKTWAALEKERRAAQETINAIEAKQLPLAESIIEHWLDSGTKSISVADIGTIYLRVDTYARAKESTEASRDLLITSGLHYLVTVNHQRASAEIRRINATDQSDDANRDLIITEAFEAHHITKLGLRTK